jgi:heterodisulfide reductase subunit B
LELEELADWNCCGATVYMSIDEMQAFALSARNLSLAARRAGGSAECTLVAPCSACYLVMNKTQRYIREYPEVNDKVRKALAEAGLQYDGRVRVRHPMDVLINDVGMDAVRARVKQPLQGLRVASYYGCLTVRPYAVFDNPYNPQSMDTLVRTLGGEPVEWTHKARCCGGSLMGTIEEVGSRLICILLKEAQRCGAETIITNCPFCQCNLECFQKDVRRRFPELSSMPVVYFTQLLGLALGLSDQALGLQRSFVSLEPMLSQLQGGHCAAR